MNYWKWYLILIIPCYLFSYTVSAKFNGRFVKYQTNSYWGLLINFFYQGLRIIINDLFGLHCPWSWEVAKKNRLAELREVLGLNGMHHEKLGHLTAFDCDDLNKQEMIARECFVSRRTFWITKLTAMLFAPIAAIFYFIKLSNKDLFYYTERDPA